MNIQTDACQQCLVYRHSGRRMGINHLVQFIAMFVLCMGIHAEQIAVNSIGFFPDSQKKATVTSSALTFEVVNALTDASLTYTVEVLDLNTNDIITIWVDQLPSWAYFDRVSNLITGTPSSEHVGTYDFSIMATDGFTVTTQQVFLSVVSPTAESIEVIAWVPPYAIAACQAAVQADFGEYDAVDGLTRVGLQFWVPQTNGTLKYADHEWYTPTDADVAWWTDWGATNEIEILLTIYNNIGSWDWNLARSAFASNRTIFVNALIAEMERLSLDGIDLDLEGIGDFESDRGTFDQFVHDLWVELDARGKILTIDSFHYIWNAPNHNWWSDWLGEVDHIHTMGYDDLYEGGTSWQKYSFQQNAGYAAGYGGNIVSMGMPSWLASWGTSSGRGTSAQAHVQEVRYDLTESTGIAIWDLQLPQWQNSDLWGEIVALKSETSSNRPPIAGFSYNTSDLTTRFTDNSTDSDGSITSWYWNFDDGNSSTLQNPSNTYGSANTYTVSLTVTDNDGATNRVNQSVTVSDSGPSTNLMTNPGFELDFQNWNDWGNSFIDTTTVHSGTKAARIGPAAGGRAQNFNDLVPGIEYTLSAWSKMDDLSTPAYMGINVRDAFSTAIANYQWTVAWTSWEEHSVSFVYPSNGASSDVWVWVSASANPLYIDDFKLEANRGNAVPNAAFTFSISNLTVIFTDRSTDSDGAIASWAWDFGDGNSSILQHPSNTYASDGTYAVNLTVTDNGGTTGSITQSVTVSTGHVAVAYPYPQHIDYAPGTIRPNHRSQAQQDDDVRAFYNHWKTSYLVAAGTTSEGDPMYRVTFGSGNPSSTVSEGQGYGMVIVATMAGYDPQAQIFFEGLWEFSRAHPSSTDPRLMDWQVPEDSGNNSAFDGDADIAYGLLLADAQWGSTGRIDYATEAATVIAAILESTIGTNSRLPMLGDWVNPNGATYNQYTPRTSDIMPGHFRAFGEITGDLAWDEVATNSQAIITSIQTHHSPVTGLLPDFVVDADPMPQPAPPNFLEGLNDGKYNWNAGRDPLRIGSDALLNNDPVSLAQVRKIAQWIANATGGNPADIKAGYSLDGTLIGNYFTTFFAAPMGVAIMTDPAQQQFLNDIYDAVFDTHEDYYQDSVNLLALLVMTGNFWSPVGNSPIVDNIPNQIVAVGADFGAIHLDDYVTDSDHTDAQMIWSHSGNTELAVNIDSNRIATITTPTTNWSGTETITWTATDPGLLSGSNAVTFIATDSDTDNDGMPDWWENLYSPGTTNLLATADEDDDHLNNLSEYIAKTNPIDPDSDDDGYNDGIEVEHFTDPHDAQNHPSGPVWWYTWQVIHAGAETNDYAMANAGQLKKMATCAYNAMSEALNAEKDIATNGFPSASNLVTSLTHSNNYEAVNTGQLKYTAMPFYHWLINEGRTNNYSWIDATETNDFSAANIGQIKHIFSFPLP